MNSKQILISIHKKYCDKIISGEKKVEFRKKVPKEGIEKVFVYETRSKRKCKLIGYFTIKEIVHDTIGNLWDCYKEISGINKEGFYEYFKNYEKGYAIVIDKFYYAPIKIDIKKSPQTYYFISNLSAKLYAENIKYMDKIYKLLNKDLEYFPDILNWFDNAIYSEDYVKIFSDDFYFILKPSKNKICRVEKLNNSTDLKDILDIIYTYLEKPIVYVPKYKDTSIESFSENGFVVTKIIDSKYNQDDKIYLMEKVAETI